VKPVDQTTFGFPGGNCFSACVASLLELPIDEVPYFMHTDDDPNGEKWFDRFEAWLRPYGFWAIFLRLAGPNDDWAPAGWCILGGQSPRARAGREDDDLHTVVAFGREVRHDPHPSRKGLVDVRDCMVLVPLDPARPQRCRPAAPLMNDNGEHDHPCFEPGDMPRDA